MHPSGGPRANVWRPSRCIAPAVPPRRQTYPQKQSAFVCAPAQIPRLGCRRSLQSSGAPRLAAGLTVPGQGGGAASEAGSGGCSVLYLWRERRPQRRAAARRGGSGGGARCGGDGRHSTHRGVHAPRCCYLLCYHSTSAALKIHLHRYYLDYDFRPSGPRAYGASSSACPPGCIAISSGVR